MQPLNLKEVNTCDKHEMTIKVSMFRLTEGRDPLKSVLNPA